MLGNISLCASTIILDNGHDNVSSETGLCILKNTRFWYIVKVSSKFCFLCLLLDRSWFI